MLTIISNDHTHQAAVNARIGLGTQLELKPEDQKQVFNFHLAACAGVRAGCPIVQALSAGEETNKVFRRRAGPEVKNKMAETKEHRTAVEGGGLPNGEGQISLTPPFDALLFPPSCASLPVRPLSKVPYFEQSISIFSLQI